MAITQPSILSLPNFSKPFIVGCNTSSCGICAVLMQEGKAIAFLSNALKGKELSLSTYEKESFVIVMAM